MKTLNIEIARNKVKILSDFLDGLNHFNSDDGLASYHAAVKVRNSMLRVGNERWLSTAKKALKAFNVISSLALNERGIQTIRLFSPTKQFEIFL